MTTRVSAVVLAAIVATPALARASDVWAFREMALAAGSSGETVGKDVQVTSISRRFRFLGGSGVAVSEWKPLQRLRQASRQALVKVQTGNVRLPNIWGLRNMRIGGGKKPQPMALVARPVKGTPIAANGTTSAQKSVQAGQERMRLRDRARLLAKQLQSKAPSKPKFRDRDRDRSGPKGRK